MPHFKIDGIQPLSVNQVWAGRRFKTKIYKEYEKYLLGLLPIILQFPQPPYILKYTFGFSNPMSDIDNPIKPFTDILQKKYHFDDKHIYRLIIDKVIVKKGSEFVEFEIKTL